MVRRFDAPEALDTRFHEVRAEIGAQPRPERSRMPFGWTINPYRGCSHACVYCFARPTHEYLDMDAGRDFEREIVVKVNAPEVAARGAGAAVVEGRAHRAGHEHRPVPVGRGPLQAHARASGRRCATLRNPCSMLTKSPLLLRDLDLMLEIAAVTDFSAHLSVPTLDEKAWRATEPHTPNPRARLEAVAELNRAGIPTGVLIAPLMPGINDAPEQVERILEAGGRGGRDRRERASRCILRGEVRGIFMELAARPPPGPRRPLRGALRARRLRPAPSGPPAPVLATTNVRTAEPPRRSRRLGMAGAPDARAERTAAMPARPPPGPRQRGGAAADGARESRRHGRFGPFGAARPPRAAGGAVLSASARPV